MSGLMAHELDAMFVKTPEEAAMEARRRRGRDADDRFSMEAGSMSKDILSGFYPFDCQQKEVAMTTGSQIDTLIALIEHGPLHDGDVPSKVGRDELIAAGLAARVVHRGEDGWTAATYKGRDAYCKRYGGDTLVQARAMRLAVDGMQRLIRGAGGVISEHSLDPATQETVMRWSFKS